MPNWPLRQISHEEIKAHHKSGSKMPIAPERYVFFQLDENNSEFYKNFRVGLIFRKNWFVYDILTSVEYAKTFMFLHQIGKEDQVRYNLKK